MTTLQKQELTSMNINEEQLLKLKQLFPEAFTEGLKIDWDKLRLTLGETIDVGKERYGMNWPGKADCFRTIQQPSIATLVPAREESINFDTTENLFIEGDNLEVLKLLQKSYIGKLKMIYFDPPYNTGNDFIYPDNYSESLDTYLTYTGQTDTEGKKFATNTETDGRFHSKWLNMLYPRLFLAKNLLSDEGVVFVSIGDQELHNLRSLMNEIFGEENYVNTICVKAKPSAGASGGGEDKRLKKNAEFLLVYVKNKEATGLDLNQAFDEIELMEHIENMRNENKSWKYTRVLKDFGTKQPAGSTIDGDGNEIKLFTHSGYVFKSINEIIQEEKITEVKAYFKYFRYVFRDTNAQSSIRGRVMDALGNNDGLFSIEYTPRSGRSKGQSTTVYYKGGNKDQLAWLKDIARCDAEKVLIKGKTGTLWLDFNWNNVSKEGDVTFPNGKKPINFIQRMLDLATKPNESHIVLDFFGGSCSTGHSVLDSNATDGGNRKFILIQLPEEINGGEFNTISDLGKQRLKNAINKLKIKTQQNSLFTNNKIDLGFKVFKLNKSNFKIWDATLEKEPEAIQAKLFEHIDHISPEAAQESILYELLLKSGFELATPIEKLILADKTVFSIAGGQLLICLEKELSHDCIKAMAEMQPTRVICLDEAFTGINADALKTNAVQIMKSKGVVNFRTV
jgi:adenine-specific DNA-methyltransferase